MVTPSRAAARSASKTKPRKQSELARLPPPIGGLNAVDPPDSLPPTDAIRLRNLEPTNYGAAVRNGFVEWAIGLGNEVRTVIPYIGTEAAGITVKRLFVATRIGIYDVTTKGAAPVLKLTFADQTGAAGRVSSVHFNTPANAALLLLCDEQNGYIVYTQSTNTFALGSMSGGPSPSQMAHIGLWNNNVIFCQRDTANLVGFNASGGIAGATTVLDLGSRLPNGGALVQTCPWTTDGGDGFNDYLVVRARGGDALVFQGTSITTDFQLRGNWPIGAPPAGRRSMKQFGGDVLLLTTGGVILASSLISGVNPVDQREQFYTRKIMGFIQDLAAATFDTIGWEMILHTRQSRMVFGIPPLPTNPGGAQLVFNFNTRGWSVADGIPMLSGDTWGNDVYYGTRDGRVLQQTGYVDEVLLTPTPANPAGRAISFGMLTGFANIANIATITQPKMLRMNFVGAGLPSVRVESRFDYDTTLVVAPPSPIVAAGALWNVSQWNVGFWAPGVAESHLTVGVEGIGHALAIAMEGLTKGRTIYLGASIIYEEGGYL